MSRLIGIAFSDLHLHPFQAFAKSKYGRLDISLDVWRHIFTVARERKVPVFFPGDLLHNPKEIENYILEKVITFFKDTHEHWKVPFIAISGNHDLCEKNTAENVSPSYLTSLDKAFEYFYCLDRDSMNVSEGVRVWGIPYLNDEKALLNLIRKYNKAADTFGGTKILMLHTDLPGCPTPSGHVVEEVSGIPKSDKLWSNFDHVLCGHIHRPTEMTKVAAMLGSPIHQDEGDEGCQMGYWEIYTNKKVFVPLTQFPKFVRVHPSDELAIDQLNAEGQYILYEEDEVVDNTKSNGKFTTRVPLKKLVTRYLKAKGTFTKERKHLLTTLLIEAKNG